jgi:uncharacterized membrane protein YcaP (DUF421 family)
MKGVAFSMEIANIFSQDWGAAGRVVIMSILCYIFLIIVLRISGKRTLTKLNAFDLVVTVTLGSTLSSAIISKDVGLIDAFTALSMLVLLQFIITWLSVRFEWFDSIVKSDHKVLFYKGEFMSHAMKKERVTKEEILAAIRQKGFLDEEEIACVVLESSGRLSVITSSKIES